MSEITDLIHAAYKRLGDMGFRFWGTWQSESDTRQRCSEGHTLVAIDGGKIVGTVTVKQSDDLGDPEWYKDPGHWIVTQFAVEPSAQKSGLGSRLLCEAEAHAFYQGGTEAAIDTAEGAKHLIDYYARRGYRHVGSVDWDGTNYVSVVMSKRLRPVLTTERLTLTEQCESDIPQVLEWWSDARFQSRYPPGRMTEELCLETCNDAIAALSNYPRSGLYWSLKLGDETIGRIRLSLEKSATGTLGYELSPRFWGSGYMTEAVKEVVRYGFAELGLYRVQAWVFANNKESQRVLERLGFKYEGALREKVEWNGTRVDDNIYGLLRTEWN